MVFKDFRGRLAGIELLQRSLERGRLAHAYLFSGHQLEELETVARALAQTLDCERPVRKNGFPIDACDTCPACQKIKHDNHADLHWVRPESKTRIIRIEQIRELSQEINLKPTEAAHKFGVIVAADRLKTEAANAFLKTLEEPPANSILLLLSTEPERVLETLLSRCLRLNFGAGGPPPLDPAKQEWLAAFTQLAAGGQSTLLGRYRLMDGLLQRLTETRAAIERELTARSPIQQYADAERETIDRWEDELAAAIEAEYRRQRSDLLGVFHWWLRDVWIQTIKAANPRSNQSSELLAFPNLAGTSRVAQRVSTQDAQANLQVLEQLQRWLATNVQESLALEVALLKLRL